MTRIHHNPTDEDRCLKCDNRKMKTWDELNFEERMIAERLPASAEVSFKKRKKHRFCTRCWFEESAVTMRKV